MSICITINNCPRRLGLFILLIILLMNRRENKILTTNSIFRTEMWIFPYKIVTKQNINKTTKKHIWKCSSTRWPGSRIRFKPTEIYRFFNLMIVRPLCVVILENSKFIIRILWKKKTKHKKLRQNSNGQCYSTHRSFAKWFGHCCSPDGTPPAVRFCCWFRIFCDWAESSGVGKS